jgi:hypothetical protein
MKYCFIYLIIIKVALHKGIAKWLRDTNGPTML